MGGGGGGDGGAMGSAGGSGCPIARASDTVLDRRCSLSCLRKHMEPAHAAYLRERVFRRYQQPCVERTRHCVVPTVRTKTPTQSQSSNSSHTSSYARHFVGRTPFRLWRSTANDSLPGSGRWWYVSVEVEASCCTEVASGAFDLSVVQESQALTELQVWSLQTIRSIRWWGRGGWCRGQARWVWLAHHAGQ